MKLVSFYLENKIHVGLVLKDTVYPLKYLNKAFHTDWSENLFDLLTNEQIKPLSDWLTNNASAIVSNDSLTLESISLKLAPLYKHPRKIWGIGLNYVAHAKDLSEKPPEEIPASFMKPDTTIVGYMDTIKIPKLSEKTTGEAELGVIIGKECYDIDQSNWLDYVAGFTTIIDMTAEDILRKNPRYLTLSKSFETFFSFGPYFLTPDELPDLKSVNVATVLNNEIWAENIIGNMTFPPDFLVTFHSKVMRMLPGDIISTGTPKASPLHDKDIIECRITNFKPLKNPVQDLKL